MNEARMDEGKEPKTHSRFSGIPARVLLAFVLMLVAFAAVSVRGFVEHERTAKELRLLRDGYLPLAMRLGEARSHQVVFRSQVESGARVSSGWFSASLQLRPSTARQLFYHLERAERLETLAQRGPDAADLTEVRESLEQLRELFSSLSARYRGEPAENERRALVTEERTASELLNQAYGILQERIGLVSSAVAERERRSAIILGVFAFLIFVVGLFVAFWIARMLAPLSRLTARVATLRQGDLSPKPPVSTRDDEVGRLALDFETMAGALSRRDERLQELRALQQDIVDALTSAVLVIDADNLVRSVNRAAERVLPVSIEVGEPVEKLTSALSKLESAIAEVRNTKGDVFIAGESVSGERALDLFVSPLDSDRDDPRILMVAEDVTEALLTKARLIDTERLAAVGRMAAHVTHEVRNPLSSIGLNVEMLEDELGTNAEARSLMSAIQKEIDRLRKITEEYLRLAKVPTPILEAEDLRDLVQSTADFCQREFEVEGVKLSIDLEDVGDFEVDESQLRQALLNLLRNAREAGGKNVWLSLEATNNGARMEVADDGEGVSEEDLEHIFDAFFTTKSAGTGLGLPLTRQIILAHGGSLRCEARQTQGTRFVLALPQTIFPQTVE